METFFPKGMPLPVADWDTKGYWEGTREHKLMIQRCSRCGAYRHPPKPVCQECYSFEQELVESQGVGDVYSYIIVYHSVHPATKDVVPFNAVMVRLRDCGGAMITSNLVGVRNEDVNIGMPVEVVWEDVKEDIPLPRFQPQRQ